MNGKSEEKLAIAFTKHKITETQISKDGRSGFFIVRCEDTNRFWFQVTFAPGVITLSGDVGELVILKKPIHWLAQAINSEDYFLSKVSSAMDESIYEFSPTEAEAWLNEQEKILKAEYEYGEYGELAEAKESIEAAREWLLEHKYLDCPSEVNIFNFMEITNGLLANEPQPLSICKITKGTRLKLAAIRCFTELLAEFEIVSDHNC